MTVLLPTQASGWKLNGLTDIKGKQHALIVYYNTIDPGCELLGFHRDRPVLWTHLRRWALDSDRRHCVVVLKSGFPGDLPVEWQGNFRFLSNVTGDGAAACSRRQRVRDIINDWLSWSTRS